MLTGVVTCGFSLAVFLVLRRLNMLRVGHATELAGIDNIDHGGPAYPELTAAGKWHAAGGLVGGGAQGQCMAGYTQGLEIGCPVLL